MPILHITPDKWAKKTSEEKEHLEKEIQDLIREFRAQGREDAWHISPFITRHSKSGGIERSLYDGSIIYLALREERVVGIMQFCPTENKRILIQFGLTRPAYERSRVDRQLLSAVDGYARAHRFKGIEFVGQSPAGRNFVISQLSPKPYYRKGKKVEGDHVNVQPANGSIHVERSYGSQSPRPPRKPLFQRLRKWLRRSN